MALLIKVKKYKAVKKLNTFIVRSFILFVYMILCLCLKANGQVYQENFRPQYHFSPQKNWINDPCGMVYLDGEYHLMYQYNPYGNQWGNMSWGHAVSKDLVHWEELPVALFPDSQGQIFSGGAVIDYYNTAGFGDSAMVAIYTSAGATQKQSIAYSLDRGRSWKKYAGNPVLPNQGIHDFRDPQVFWHQESAKWIMTLAVLDRIEIYSSPDLKNWRFESDFGQTIGAHGGVWECPDLFPIRVEGQTEPVWVLMVSLNPGSPSGGSGTQYFLGNFDGSTFTLTEEFRELLTREQQLPQGLLFENFEGTDYSGWTVTGNAFGTSPAAGTLANQQRVSGYRGERLVNTYLNGDESQGKLISAPFTIRHGYINFLIGGGNHPGLAEVRLIVDGKKVASATGRNEEHLRWHAWNVEQFLDAEAHIEIVDLVGTSWGHLNVDHIFFSDEEVVEERVDALWADYGPDFYAGRSWVNGREDNNQRVWLAWMNNWAYAGNLPTDGWRGSMSLPRVLAVHRNNNGHLRLYQHPAAALTTLRSAHASYSDLSIAQLNQQITAAGISGTRYEINFTLVPGSTAERTGVEVRKGSSGTTVVGYDPALNAVFIDRGESGRSFSDAYEKVFYAPLESLHQELNFRIFVDESSVEVFVNDGALVQTARIFPWPSSNQINFYGSEEVVVKQFDFWGMESIWQDDKPPLAVNKDLMADTIKLFPNPVTSTFYMSSSHAVSTATLISSTGNQIPLQYSEGAKNTTFTLPISQPAGLYFLKIAFMDGNVVVKKLLVQ